MKKIIFILTLLMFCFCLIGCHPGYSYDYVETHFTEDELIENVGSRIEKHFSIRSQDYEITPLYDQNEKLTTFLVEFSNGGFTYIRINYHFLPAELKPFDLYGLYAICYMSPNLIREGWYTTEVVDGIGYVEKDEEDRIIKIRDNHFKCSNIDKNQRWYLVELELERFEQSYYFYIPAIKVDGIFINVITMEPVNYNVDHNNYVDYNIYFIFFQ